MSDLCLPLGLEQGDIAQLEQIVTTSSVKHAGDVIVRQGAEFTRIFAVKSGMCKSTRVDLAGNEHVQNFHLPGELFGLHAIYAGKYGFSVEALNTVVLCELKYDELQKLSSELPSLQRQLLNLLSRDLYHSQVNALDHFDQSAEQKLAGFIHNLYSRFVARGYEASSFHLPMSRKDIASHLELAPETISRLLKKFQQKQVIQIDNRLVEIKDLPALEQLVHCHALEASVDVQNIGKLA